MSRAGGPQPRSLDLPERYSPDDPEVLRTLFGLDVDPE